MLLYIRQGVILSLVVLMSALALGGCLYLKPRRLADIDADISALKENGTRIERLNAETDKKIAEIYGHLYTLQEKVYSNENEINALKAQLIPETTPEESEPEPAEKTSKTAPQPTQPEIPPAPDPVEINPEEAYKSAHVAYEQGAYEKAISLFTEFIKKYPKHDLADNSQYWMGECYYAMKDYQSALQAFKKVIDKYPGGNKMPDALLKIGYSYLTLKDPQNARTFLTRVVKDYPFSAPAQNAEIKLRKIGKIEELRN